jgi:hypothetical protein
MNDSTSVHSQLNNRSGDPGPVSDPSATYNTNNRRCWACHNNGSVTGSGSMGLNKTTPWQCDDCHLASGSENSKYTILTIAEHYLNGADIQAATDSATDVLSCLGCHNKSEMLNPANDPDFGTFSDTDGDGVVGGNSSFYHYGKNRTSDIVTSGVTDCDYCHQNTSTAFASAMDVNVTYHSDMDDHTDRAGGPACTDSDCHASGRIHDSALTKPATLYDNALCITCHTATGQGEVHALTGPNANNLFCADCHTDPSAYSQEKQIHGIRYITSGLTYSTAWDNSSTADCTECHQQGASVTNINNTAPPQIPVNLNHSNNDSAGSIWNNTATGYLGPWKPAVNNIRACLYCHGNVPKASTDPADIDNILHNASALGRVNLAYLNDIDSEVNGSIDTTSFYCSECHYNGNSNYSAMASLFAAAGFEAPQNNTGVPVPGDPSYFYNHDSSLSSGYSDDKCKNCHGELLTPTAKMDEFAHNVGIGVAGGSDCGSSSCHDGGTAPDINWTSFELGVHANLNQDATNTSPLTRSSAKACWACHGDGTDPGSSHPVNQSTPWRCPDCHAQNQANSGKYSSAPNITAHMPTNVTGIGSNLTTDGTNAYCTNCHDEDIGDSSGSESAFAGQSLLANVSHFAQNDTLVSSTTFINATAGQSANCTYCHYGDAPTRAAWGNAIDPRATVNHKPEWNATNCGACHYQSLAGSLHDPQLTGAPNGGPSCVFCHDNYNTSFYPNATKVNVTAMNQSYR